MTVNPDIVDDSTS